MMAAMHAHFAPNVDKKDIFATSVPLESLR